MDGRIVTFDPCFHIIVPRDGLGVDGGGGKPVLDESEGWKQGQHQRQRNAMYNLLRSKAHDKAPQERSTGFRPQRKPSDTNA